MKKTLLVCSVVFFGLGASAQVKKEAAQTTTTPTELPTDRVTARKIQAQKQEQIRIAQKLEAIKAEERSHKSTKQN